MFCKFLEPMPAAATDFEYVLTPVYETEQQLQYRIVIAPVIAAIIYLSNSIVID